MAQQLFKDALVLVKAAPTGGNGTEVDVSTTPKYTDSSFQFLGGNIDDSGEVATVRPHGIDPRGEPLAGAVTGTITLNYLSNDGATPIIDFDAGMFWTGIWETPSRRFAFAIQPNREALKGTAAIVGPPAYAIGEPQPGSVAGNPQSTGSAVLTSISYWGDGTAESPMLVNVVAQVARGFTRHFS